MKLQQNIPLSSIYKREEDFSSDLSENLTALGIGFFEPGETESHVGTRRADIVSTGDDGKLVIENQFGKADWDHWGRLEAYARLKEASVAALVAESFEELMVVTCNLRNEDSDIDWYLIQARVNAHKELSFHHVSRPAIDIQMEKKAGVEYSEFWEPVRKEGLFSGKPVPLRDEGWISKSVRGVQLLLQLRNHTAYIRLSFQGADRIEKREEVMQLFPESQYGFEYQESAKYTFVIFPVMDKGKKDRDYWPVIREQLVAKGTDIYNTINESEI